MQIPNDPRFPDRPTHPDFALLCAEAQTNDNLCELGDNVFTAVVNTFVDLESLFYLTENRAGSYCQVRGVVPTPLLLHLIQAAMIDGFVIGAGVERRKWEDRG
jgi:hypothetical protein